MMRNVARGLVFTGLILFAVPGVCGAVTSRYHDLHKQKLSSGAGSFEFRFQLLKDIAADPHNHVLMLGVSSDGAESFEVQIIQDGLLAQRRSGRCVLTSFVHRYNFQIGEWHTLKLAWSGDTSRFYVDDREVKKLGLFSSADLPKMVPGIRIGLESNFRVDQFHASAGSDVREDPEDKAFVKDVVCTDLPRLLAEPPQEEYRGVALRHFPDPASRGKIKAYIDLLPEDFARAVKSVVFVEDARFLKGGQGGFADQGSGSLVLKGSIYDDPTVFFHEAAHLYDLKRGINFGVPEERNEWARISGAQCYYKGAKMEDYYKDFLKNKDKNAFLGAQGGQCASEDLAIWVGTAYDYYLRGKTFKDRLDPASPSCSPKSRIKLEFILKKGFISQKVYDKLL